MIKAEHLTKRYGDHTAVSDLNFTIGDGGIYGLLGPNGAGKSTTMNIMTGCLASSEGTVSIDDYDIFEDEKEAKKRIGYLPEIPPVYPDRTPYEYLMFVAEAKRIPPASRQDEVERVIALTRMEEYRNRLIRNLSKGYRQRVGIAQALLGNPKYIILDEPTVGLDPRQMIEIREMIRDLGKDHTVILSSHILSEVQEVCETILILSEGKLAACDTAENLEKKFQSAASVHLRAECKADQAQSILRSVPGITGYHIEEEAGVSLVELDTDDPDSDSAARKLFFAFAKENVPILEMTGEKTSLEDIFLKLTGNSSGQRTGEMAGNQSSASTGQREEETAAEQTHAISEGEGAES